MNREDLQNYRAIVLTIELLEEERQRLLAQLLAPRQYRDEPRAKGGYCDPVGEIASKLADLRMLIDKNLDILIDRRKLLEESIEGLSPEAQNIVFMRYLLGYSWEQLASKLGYTYQWAHTLHKKALKEWERKNGCAKEIRKGA